MSREDMIINLDGKIYCACDTCVELREEWTKRQPALIQELDSRDGEDFSFYKEIF